MPNYTRDFKGIWIPKDIWLSDELSLMEKVLFVEIHSLDNEKGCWAANRHFAEFFGISDRQIRKLILSLKKKGFVSVTIKNRYERVIRCKGKYARISDDKLKKLNEMREQLAQSMSIGSSIRVGTKARRG